MQLVAYGAQDIYLTGNPQITFWKVVYRRHTLTSHAKLLNKHGMEHLQEQLLLDARQLSLEMVIYYTEYIYKQLYHNNNLTLLLEI